MDNSIATQLRFPASAGFTIRAEFDGGAMSSDIGAFLLRGIDRQIGLIPRLVSAIHDKRHASYIDAPLADLLRQRIFQTASGYADGNDANTLRCDPLFKLAVGRAPRDEGNDLACGLPRWIVSPRWCHQRIGTSMSLFGVSISFLSESIVKFVPLGFWSPRETRSGISVVCACGHLSGGSLPLR
jgi:hypothetical protein